MKRALGWATVVVVIVLGLGVRAVLVPPVADAPVGDAIVVHDGGHGERLRSGLALAANQAAPVVVVMNGENIDWPNGQRLCDQTEPFVVICPQPRPESTVGEAAVIQDLIVAQNWRRVVIVTSDYHLRRALMLDAKCAGDATLLGAGAPADITALRHTLLVIREVAALPHAWLAGCG